MCLKHVRQSGSAHLVRLATGPNHFERCNHHVLFACESGVERANVKAAAGDQSQTYGEVKHYFEENVPHGEPQGSGKTPRIMAELTVHGPATVSGVRAGWKTVHVSGNRAVGTEFTMMILNNKC